MFNSSSKCSNKNTKSGKPLPAKFFILNNRSSNYCFDEEDAHDSVSSNRNIFSENALANEERNKLLKFLGSRYNPTRVVDIRQDESDGYSIFHFKDGKYYTSTDESKNTLLNYENTEKINQQRGVKLSAWWNDDTQNLKNNSGASQEFYNNNGDLEYMSWIYPDASKTIYMDGRVHYTADVDYTTQPSHCDIYKGDCDDGYN
jgi:hypothetical protein